MKRLPFFALAGGALMAFSCGGKPKLDEKALAEKTGQANFEKVASFEGMQVTGVTVSKDGRIFANFPRWREGVRLSVVEVKADGSSVPYPNRSWNEWNGSPRENGFTCVQSVVAHGDSLFVLDPSNPQMKGVVGKPALYEFDLKTNSLKNKWTFDESSAPPRSYLNDLRVDDKRKMVYITDSGLGALVVLDMKNGKARRLLEQHPSTKTEPMVLYPNGKALTKTNGMPLQMHSDGIEFRDDHVYYHAVTGTKLYRVPAAALTNASLSATALGKKVEDLGQTPPPDGLLFDKDGNLYMADLQSNSVVYRTPMGTMRTLVKDENLHWADTFAMDPEGRILFTDSRIDQVAPRVPASGYIFHIYRVNPKTL